jgi:voltage-gated potassium channel
MTVILTIYEIILVALLSGVIVSHYLELVRRREQEAVVVFIDKLEHLTELSYEELQDIERKARRLK